MSGNNDSSASTQVYEIYIKASAQAIWDAITTPEWSARYGYRAAMEYELRKGGAFRTRATPQMCAMGLPETILDGEVLESDPPNKLVQTYRFLFNAAHKAEGFTRVTWEVVPTESGFTRLTVTHDRLEKAPIMAGMLKARFNERGAGGWNFILSDLKSLLETGSTLS